MMAQSKESSEQAMARMLPPFNASIFTVSHELNLLYPTLYTWRAESSKQRADVPPVAESDDQFDSQSKFQVVLETATLAEADLAAYCRSKGLYVEQIAQWRAQCEAAFNPKPISAAERASVKRIQLLERELLRKEKALAEAATLMILRKKSGGDLGIGRGAMISTPDRRRIITLINEPVATGARHCAIRSSYRLTTPQ